MAHYVKRKGYWSLEESYRDPVTGKPRKRYLAYLGHRSDDPQARMAQMLDTAERKAGEIDDMQRVLFGETANEKKSREEQEQAFTPQTFLEDTAAEPAPEVNDAEQPSEPDAGGQL